MLLKAKVLRIYFCVQCNTVRYSTAIALYVVALNVSNHQLRMSARACLPPLIAVTAGVSPHLFFDALLAPAASSMSISCLSPL